MKKLPLKVYQVARVCHEANRALQAALGESVVSKPWDNLDFETKCSALDGVLKVIREPHTTPKMLHENWCRFKWENGWQYAPVRDDEKKLHPCLVRYEDLPAEQIMKDVLFGNILRSLIVTPGGEIAAPEFLPKDAAEAFFEEEADRALAAAGAPEFGDPADYICHKRVFAFRIAAIEMRPGTTGNVFEVISKNRQYKVLVDRAWIGRHNPEVGGYFVRYEDEYTSYSPDMAFEKGYTLAGAD